MTPSSVTLSLTFQRSNSPVGVALGTTCSTSTKLVRILRPSVTENCAKFQRDLPSGLILLTLGCDTSSVTFKCNIIFNFSAIKSTCRGGTMNHLQHINQTRQDSNTISDGKLCQISEGSAQRFDFANPGWGFQIQIMRFRESYGKWSD